MENLKQTETKTDTSNTEVTKVTGGEPAQGTGESK